MYTITMQNINVLIIFQGATQLTDLQVAKHTNYTHHSSTKEFQQSLAEVVVDELVSEVGESGISVLCLMRVQMCLFLRM